jgi:AmiR/NasT family two-component response regulator
MTLGMPRPSGKLDNGSNRERRVVAAARVLIVEDDVLQADNLEALVTLHGHRVCGSVRTGEAAVALAKAATPDVVLMDRALAG